MKIIKFIAMSIFKGMLGFLLIIKNILEYYFGRQCYYILLEATVCVVFIFLRFLRYGILDDRTSISALVYIAAVVVYIFHATVIQQKRRKENQIFGFVRLDKTLEVHIGDTSNKRVFHRKLLNSIVYCQIHNLKIEFISGYYTFGKLMQEFGEAIILIKPLNLLSQIYIGGVIQSFEKTPSVNSRHLLKVVIEPKLIKLKHDKKGRPMLKNTVGG